MVDNPHPEQLSDRPEQPPSQGGRGAARGAGLRTYRCGWCGLDGHQRRACHVEAEGRRDIDAADHVASELARGTRWSRATRSRIAARLRELDAAGVVVMRSEVTR